jgi:hypothetical protein
VGWGNKSIEIGEVVSDMKPLDAQRMENIAFDLRRVFVHFVQQLRESVRNVVRR